MNWKCLNCGVPMNYRMALAVERRTGISLRGMLHFCGVCKEPHRCDQDLRLQKLDGAQRLRVEMEAEEAMAIARQAEDNTIIFLPKAVR